jgi:hypothetical protein
MQGMLLVWPAWIESIVGSASRTMTVAANLIRAKYLRLTNLTRRILLHARCFKALQKGNGDRHQRGAQEGTHLPRGELMRHSGMLYMQVFIAIHGKVATVLPMVKPAGRSCLRSSSLSLYPLAVMLQLH